MTIKPKIAPEYDGVDVQLQSYVDEYVWLSKQNHIRFYNKVTIGFKHVGVDNVIGVCHHTPFFREIDIDIKFWRTATYSEKTALMYHELGHCYCGRNHDYDTGIAYAKDSAAMVEETKGLMGLKRKGFWDDGCPVSLMYPIVIEDKCMRKHYAEYTSEMFNRCQPY